MFNGALNQEVNIVDQCIKDSGKLSIDITNIYKGFSAHSLSGYKDGIIALSDTLKAIPDAVKDCQEIKIDPEQIQSMADIIQHPLSMIVNVGKNLVINGVDILFDVSDALQAFSKQDFVGFGKALGKALQTIFKHAPYQVQVSNQMEDEFFQGFFSALGQQKDFNYVDFQKLFHNLGDQVYTPSGQTIEQIRLSEGDQRLNTEIALKTIAQSLSDAAGILVVPQRHLITQIQENEINQFSSCIKSAKITHSSEEINNMLIDSIRTYKDKYMNGVGAIVGKLALEACPQSTQDLFLTQ
ncbi:UNKNOWN [Stylonychia lemnae]|uniref:Uncharacterized protein n=1 Tax=Stylonychia lemnae TaxID=5949 RepID=A0A078B8V0_STYLE|nr:UNKNOWN [Stylonychia lemnae]|eukprot:CDW90839.1 UNKNOWN [Stylonychia lemnae]